MVWGGGRGVRGEGKMGGTRRELGVGGWDLGFRGDEKDFLL